MRCPRCKIINLDAEKVMNSLSRRDNETYICNPCGTEESMLDAGMIDCVTDIRKAYAREASFLFFLYQQMRGKYEALKKIKG